MELLQYFSESDDYCAIFTAKVSYKKFNLLHASDRQIYNAKDQLFTTSAVFYFRKPSNLIEPFNKEIHKFQEAGLIEFWRSKYRDDRKDKPRNEPKGLVMFNLMIIFEISAAMYLIGFIVFILEVFSEKCARVKRALDYITY